MTKMSPRVNVHIIQIWWNAVMKANKGTVKLLIPALLIVVVLGIAAATLLNHKGPAERRAEAAKPTNPVPTPAAQLSRVSAVPSEPTGPLKQTVSSLVASNTLMAASNSVFRGTTNNLPAKSAKKSGGSGQKVVLDPVAREALVWVGADPDAEAYWFEALNNPALPQSERQDLIDDLNEEGLADPKHPTPDELPLILARIEIIEDLAPWMPSYDWDEPYNDLTQLVRVILGSGETIH